MVKASELTYEEFHDRRTERIPDFKAGMSGKLLLATDSNAEKYIVKYARQSVVINEYTSCWLADMLGVKAPKAMLLSKHKKFGPRNAVALKKMELDKSVDLQDLSHDQKKDYAKAILFNHIIGNDSGDGIEIFATKCSEIVTLDFGEASFCTDEWIGDTKYMNLCKLYESLNRNEDDLPDTVTQEQKNIFKKVLENCYLAPKENLQKKTSMESVLDFMKPKTDFEILKEVIKEISERAKDISTEQVEDLRSELSHISETTAKRTAECVAAMIKNISNWMV